MATNTEWKGWKPGEAQSAFTVAFCGEIDQAEVNETKRALRFATWGIIGQVVRVDWLSSRQSDDHAPGDLHEVLG